MPAQAVGLLTQSVNESISTKSIIKMAGDHMAIMGKADVK